MEKTNLWTTLKSIFANEENSEDFEKELKQLQKVQEQVHADRTTINEYNFGKSLKVNTVSGKAKKGKGIQNPIKNDVVQEKEDDERIY